MLPEGLGVKSPPVQAPLGQSHTVNHRPARGRAESPDDLTSLTLCLFFSKQGK